MTGAEWLRWFVAPPQARCEKCRRFNEVNAPSWYGGNCWHWRMGERS